jgi:hypothetical protein
MLRRAMATSFPAAAPKPVYPQGQNPGLRYIEPYYFPYKTFAKQRWHGRELLEIVSTEFRDRYILRARHSVEVKLTAFLYPYQVCRVLCEATAS